MSSNVMNNQVTAQASSQYVSIVPENGEAFNPGQKIIYNIEPEIGFIKRDSFMIFDVVNTSTEFQRMTFTQGCGIHSIIDNINIYSKETGILLESLQNYAQWRNIEHQYLYDDNSQLSLKEGVNKDTHPYSYDNDPAVRNSNHPNASNIEDNQLSPVQADCSPRYAAVRFTMPLKTGLLGWFDSEKLIPILNFGGLRIEIVLQRPELALQKIKSRVVRAAVPGTQMRETLLFDPETNGFFAVADNAGGDVFGGGVACFMKVGNGTTIENIADLGLAVGNTMKLQSATSVGGARTDVGGGAHKITAIALSGATNTVAGVTGQRHIAITFDGAMPAFSNNQVGAGNLTHFFVLVPSTINYKVMKTEYRLLQITPPPQVAASIAKGINYEFTSYETFLDNIPATVQRHQIPINSVASKALAIFSLVYDSNNAEDLNQQSYYAGLPPLSSEINNVVYFINNRLYPLRSYNPSNFGDKVLTLNELTKSWRAIGKDPVSLGSNEFGDLNGYTNTFLLSRELARDGFVFDLRNAEPEIRLQFNNGARADVLRVNSFVFSKRIVQTTAQGVQVIY